MGSCVPLSRTFQEVCQCEVCRNTCQTPDTSHRSTFCIYSVRKKTNSWKKRQFSKQQTLREQGGCSDKEGDAHTKRRPLDRRVQPKVRAQSGGSGAAGWKGAGTRCPATPCGPPAPPWRAGGTLAGIPWNPPSLPVTPAGLPVFRTPV